MLKLAIELNSRPEGTIAYFHGDASNIYPNQVFEALQPILFDHAHTIVFDMSDLTFIATEALGELIAFWHEVQEYRGIIHLAGANANIENVMRKTRLVELFPIYPTVEAALN